MLKLHLGTKHQILAFLLNYGPKTLITRKKNNCATFSRDEENKDKNQRFVRKCTVLVAAGLHPT